MNYPVFGVALSLLLAGTAVTQAASPKAGPSSSGPSGLVLAHEGHAGATHATGVINAIDAAQRKVNVSHRSIKQLGWPAMTMDFPVSADVDLTPIKPGMKVNFTLIKGNGGAWTVDALKPSPKQ